MCKEKSENKKSIIFNLILPKDFEEGFRMAEERNSQNILLVFNYFFSIEESGAEYVGLAIEFKGEDIRFLGADVEPQGAITIPPYPEEYISGAVSAAYIIGLHTHADEIDQKRATKA